MLDMMYTLLGVALLLSQVSAGCPKRCRCPETADNLIFEMHCNNASFTQVPNGQLREVFFIDLSFNNITTLKNNTFVDKDILKLLRLYLNNNGLETIEELAFRGLTQLKLLNLELNDVSTLLPNVFEDSAQLEVLNLNGNQHLKLPDTGLQLPILNILSLNHCGLKTLPTQFFKNMLHLEYLFLRGNDLSVFDPQLIQPLTQLKKLDLRDNKFTWLQFDLHETFPETLVIDFDGNPLHCACELESTYSLNKEKKLYDFLTCGTPVASSLNKFLLDSCMNTTPASLVRIKSTSRTSPLESSSSSPFYTTTTTSASSTVGVTSPVIVPEDEDAHKGEHAPHDFDTTLEMNGRTGWIALSAVVLSLMIVGCITVIIKRQKKTHDYRTPRRFTKFEYDDEEQSFVT